jgi:hypothetical protein
MKTIEKIKGKLQELAELHKKEEEDFRAEILEYEAVDLISAYCMSFGYKVNDFPDKLINQDIKPEDFYDLEASSEFEPFKQYIDRLALEKKDVAELMWFYTQSFWPDTFDTKEDYLQSTKALLDAGISYDFEL